MAKTPSSQCTWPGSIPGQGTRSHLLELRPDSQINKYFYLFIYCFVYLFLKMEYLVFHNLVPKKLL